MAARNTGLGERLLAVADEIITTRDAAGCSAGRRLGRDRGRGRAWGAAGRFEVGKVALPPSHREQGHQCEVADIASLNVLKKPS